MFKVIIAGSRSFNQYDLIKAKLDFYFSNRLPAVEIVSGTVRGADVLGEHYAKEHNLKVKKFLANWDLYGKRAGIIRNEQMAKEADALVAFWDGHSSGTKHIIDKMKKMEKPVRIVLFTL